jgi:uncharacterized protein (TIGR03437 family)
MAASVLIGRSGRIPVVERAVGKLDLGIQSAHALPDDTAVGPVSIQVRNARGASNVGTILRARVAPTLHTVASFAVEGKQHAVAFTPDFVNFIGNPGMVQGLRFVRARPGDTIAMYALGLGPTNPPTRAGVITSALSPITLPLELKIGGAAARVAFAGAIPNTIGLYQINAVVPNVPAGDQPIELSVDGIPNGQNLVLAVGAQ